MPRPAVTLFSKAVPAAMVLAVGFAPAASAGGAADAADEGVVRLSAPAAPTADAADAEDGVVIRAQNRAGRGRRVAPKRTRRVVRRAPRAAATSAAPRPAVRQVAAEVPAPAPAPAPTLSYGPVPDGTVPAPGAGGAAASDCPECRGNCPPGGCPTCLALPGLPGLGCPGLGCPGGGLCRPGGYFNRGGVWSPQHIHNYSYNEPRGLSYPPGANPNVPGQQGPMPVVQYPYYTTKGPDDFLHDRDGQF